MAGDPIKHTVTEVFKAFNDLGYTKIKRDYWGYRIYNADINRWEMLRLTKIIKLLNFTIGEEHGIKELSINK